MVYREVQVWDSTAGAILPSYEGGLKYATAVKFHFGQFT